MSWTPIPQTSLKWLSVDFDETIVHNSGFPDYIPNHPVKGAIQALKNLDKKGYKIIVYTARPWGDYSNIEDWLLEYGVPFRRIVCGKLLAKWYIDDRNFGTTIDWKEIELGL